MIYSVCQFPRYKYSQQGQFQAPDMMPLTADWRRGSSLYYRAVSSVPIVDVNNWRAWIIVKHTELAE